MLYFLLILCIWQQMIHILWGFINCLLLAACTSLIVSCTLLKLNCDTEFHVLLDKEWLKPYAAFCFLRDFFETSDHSQWGRFSQYSRDKVRSLMTPFWSNWELEISHCSCRSCPMCSHVMILLRFCPWICYNNFNFFTAWETCCKRQLAAWNNLLPLLYPIPFTFTSK